MTVTVNGSAPTQSQQKQMQDAMAVASDMPDYKRPTTFGFAGDSIGGYWSETNGLSPLMWASSLLYPCNISRIMNTSAGGVSSSHLISVQIGQLEALNTKPDVVIVQSLQNDFMNSQASADGFVANVTEYATRALAAGVKSVWICSRPPKSETGAGVPDAIVYANRKLEIFCAITSGCYYIDVFNVWRNMNISEATTRINYRDQGSSPSSFSVDGVHPTTYACRVAANLVDPLLRQFVRPIRPLPSSLNAYNNSTAQWNNILGPNGFMLGTSGQLDGVNNSGVAGTVANDQNRWKITTGNGVTVTPSLYTDPDTGFIFQELVFGGTATADTNIDLGITPATAVVSGTFITEGIVKLVNISQIRGVQMTSTNVDCGVHTPGGGVAEFPASFTGELHLRSKPYTLSQAGASGILHRFRFPVGNGRSPAGTIRVGMVGTYRLTVD